MKGLILSGGRGNRLRPLTHSFAKQLVPVANKPVLFYGIEALVEAGITDIGIVTGDTGDEVRAATGNGERFGARITYLPQSEPLGLAHAVKTAQGFIGESPFIMYLGDNIVRDGVSDAVAHFDRANDDATVLLARMKSVERLGVAVVQDDRIVRLVEKPVEHVSDLAVVGAYLLRWRIFDAIDRIEPSPRGELEMTDALQRLIDDGRRVTPWVITGWWKDTGRAEDMLEANRIMLGVLAERHDGAVADTARLEGTVVIEPGAVLTNCVVRGPVIIGARTVIDDAYIGPFTSVQDDCVIRNAEIEHSIVLQGTTIENLGTKIEDSLIGRECVIRRSPVRPSAHKLVLGDHSSVELDD